MNGWLKAILALLFALHVNAGAPPAAEDSPLGVSFGAFPLPLKRTYASADPGLPAGKAEFRTPFPNDFPPSLTVMLEDMRQFLTELK